VHQRYQVKSKTISFNLMSYSCFEKRLSGDCEVDFSPPPNVLHYVRCLFDRYLTEMFYWQRWVSYHKFHILSTTNALSTWAVYLNFINLRTNCSTQRCKYFFF